MNLKLLIIQKSALVFVQIIFVILLLTNFQVLFARWTYRNIEPITKVFLHKDFNSNEWMQFTMNDTYYYSFHIPIINIDISYMPHFVNVIVSFHYCFCMWTISILGIFVYLPILFMYNNFNIVLVLLSASVSLLYTYMNTHIKKIE